MVICMTNKEKEKNIGKNNHLLIVIDDEQTSPLPSISYLEFTRLTNMLC